MSEFREREDEDRFDLMDREEDEPRTAYEAYLADLGRPDFERPA
jgi:hypothetical protein